VSIRAVKGLGRRVRDREFSRANYKTTVGTDRLVSLLVVYLGCLIAIGNVSRNIDRKIDEGKQPLRP